MSLDYQRHLASFKDGVVVNSTSMSSGVNIPGPNTRQLKVLVAHDYLTQRGGAERVALLLSEAFGRRIITSVFNAKKTYDAFASIEVRQTILGWFPAFKADPRIAFPFLAPVWSGLRTQEPLDVLLCSSSGWAHAMKPPAGAVKVIYCHNPARWLYQPDDYFAGSPTLLRSVANILGIVLRIWDRRAARSADLYIANSSVVAERIRSAYGIEPKVVFPPVAIDARGEQCPLPEISPGFYLSVGRARGYKGTDSVEEAFAHLPAQRLVIVGGEARPSKSPNVTRVGRVSDAQLRWLYANATALISVSKEDFGLTPIEANAHGTPALVLRAGGFLDSTAEGISGQFIEDATLESIVQAVENFPAIWDKDKIVAHAHTFSPDVFVKEMESLMRETVERCNDKGASK